MERWSKVQCIIGVVGQPEELVVVDDVLCGVLYFRDAQEVDGDKKLSIEDKYGKWGFCVRKVERFLGKFSLFGALSSLP